MDLYKIIDQLEYELSDKRGLFGKKVDIDKCWQLVLELKREMPDYLEAAKQVAQDREQLLKNADTVAKSIIGDAEARRASMLDRAELARKAELEGQKILAHAHKQSDKILSDTKSQLDDVFCQTEQYIQTVADNITKSRAELRDIVGRVDIDSQKI